MSHDAAHTVTTAIDLAYEQDEPALEHDTLEARTIRAEATTAAALERVWSLENELRAVDEALQAERVPLELDDDTDTRLTRAGRVRALGDRARRAEVAVSLALAREPTGVR